MNSGAVSCLLRFSPFFPFVSSSSLSYGASSSVSQAKMAASLQRRVLPFGRALLAQARSFSSEALVEIKPGEIGMVSGIPKEQLKRKVMIYSPARTASQQGSGKVGKWKINFLSTQKWENPLMGWTSTGDPYANVGDAALYFDSEEAAKAFAEKHGWQYVVRKRHTPLIKPKSYADNFKWKGPPTTQEPAKTAAKTAETPKPKTEEAAKPKESPKAKA